MRVVNSSRCENSTNSDIEWERSETARDLWRQIKSDK